jgi:pSer/pThr/pTyr-binding forkhead associated (FHA) protein
MRTIGPDTDASPVRERSALLALERDGLPFLVIQDGDDRQRLIVIESDDDYLTLGRRSTCDIVVDWDQRVSAIHVELRRTGGTWTIVDDGLSTNGTFVNGQRVAGRRRLAHSDTITVGETTLLFRNAPDSADPSTLQANDVQQFLEVTKMQRAVLIALCRPFGGSPSLATPATNQEIAAELVLSVEAIKSHLRALSARFEVEALPQNAKRLRVAELAMQHGLVGPRDYTQA